MAVQFERDLAGDFQHRGHQRANAVGREQSARVLDHHHVDIGARDQLRGFAREEFIRVHGAFAEHHGADRFHAELFDFQEDADDVVEI